MLSSQRVLSQLQLRCLRRAAAIEATGIESPVRCLGSFAPRGFSTGAAQGMIDAYSNGSLLQQRLSSGTVVRDLRLSSRGFCSSSDVASSNKANSGSASDELVKYENIGGGIGILTLNNPRKRNALSTAMMNSLLEKIKEIEKRATAGSSDRNSVERVVILRAEGPVFCAGHDLSEFYKDNSDHAAIFALCTKVMESIRLSPLIFIAEVGTLATAAGCQLVASTDLIVASEKAAFATPGVSIGLFCTTPGVALARSVPHRKALEMLLTGDPISAAEAHQYGLVNIFTTPEDLHQRTIQLAQRIARSSGDVLKIGKKAFYEQIKKDQASAYPLAENVMCDNLCHKDAKEGIGAFLSKRHPTWST